MLTSYEPAVLAIGELARTSSRREAIVSAALDSLPSSTTKQAREAAHSAVERTLAGFRLEGWGEIANRLDAARRAARGAQQRLLTTGRIRERMRA